MFNAGIAQVAAVATGGGVPAGTDGQNDQSFLTAGSQNDGPGTNPATPITGSKTVPAAISTLSSREIDNYFNFMDVINAGQSKRGGESLDPEDHRAQEVYNELNNKRLGSNINFNHPSIVKALKLRHHQINSLTAF
jgi:hypothetical protein